MKNLRVLVGLLLVVVLLTGCGNKLTTEEEYLLNLVRSGDYAMAIQVIENIRIREGGAAVETAVEEMSETIEESEEPVETKPQMSQRAQMAMDAVNRFLEEEGYALMQAFEEVTADNAADPVVTHAMEYRLGNCDGNGNVSHLLLVMLDMDVAYDNGVNDFVQLVLDLDTQTLYNSSRYDEAMVLACNGMPTNEEEFNMIALNSYCNFRDGGDMLLMADLEIQEIFTQEEITAINNALLGN